MSSAFYRSAFWKRLREERLHLDNYRCTVPGCCESFATSRLHVDHRETRPNVAYPTAADVIGNLRTLCDFHDRQLKERRDGSRRTIATVKGCAADGTPLDPGHPWNRDRRRSLH